MTRVVRVGQAMLGDQWRGDMHVERVKEEMSRCGVRTVETPVLAASLSRHGGSGQKEDG
jgi:hypothetical protein